MSSFAVYDTIWARFVGGVSADESEQQTIADALTASTGRSHTVVEVEEDDNGGAGANPVSDGLGCMFFGGFNLAVGLDGVKVYTDFVTNDESRAPQRDDLMVVDGEDNTTINVVRSGLYDISLNVPVGPANINFVPETPVEIHAFAVFEVNGDEGEYPSTAYNNHAWWRVSEAGFQPPVSLSLTFPQVLEAGDTIQLGFKAIQDHHDDDPLNGNLALVPDITMVCTYRGPVE